MIDYFLFGRTVRVLGRREAFTCYLEKLMESGKFNAGAGLGVMAGFMAYGFLLIYLRDFAPDKEAWDAS